MLKQLIRISPLFDRRDKLKYLGLLVMMTFGAFLDVVGIGAVPAFVAVLAVPEKVMEIPLASSLLESLGLTEGSELVIWGALGLIAIFIVKNVYLLAIYTLQVRTTEYHQVRLATRLFSAYLFAPWEFHLEYNSSELLRNVYAETKEIMTGVIDPMLHLAMNAMMTILAVALLLLTTPGVAVLGFGLVGGASWLFLRVFRKRLERYGLAAKHERKEMIQAVNQGLAGLMDVRVLGCEPFFIQVLQRSVANFARVSRLRQVINKASPNMLEMVAVTGLLGIVLVLVSSGSDTNSLVPMLALYGAAIVRLRQTVGQIVGSISQIEFSGAAIPAILGDLDRLERINRNERARSPELSDVSFQDSIRISNVIYTYPNTERRVLDDVNLNIRKGESIAFVGATGSGKSTLVNVLLGFLKPQQGAITVDTTDIHTNLRGWLDHVGYIPQSILLLDDTVRRNIAFGIPDAEIDEEQLIMAVNAAQLAGFIESLPRGLDTVVGERGIRFSGGQRQRVGLARALYHSPDVLVMDEATSALDNSTESQVMKTLNELKEGRTFIIIAHRLSTVQECDRLFFMKDGRIEAEGTYEELSRIHLDFRRMVEVA